MDIGVTSRPRNVDWKRAAALLYGDWGTSKAYVTGIGFAVAAGYLGTSYASFWLVLAVAALTAMVGLNYTWVCKYFPEGGGVYSAAKAHSRHLALVGGFLLVANYLVTASLSCFEAFVYFGFDYVRAKELAIFTIFIIGAINFFGPRHSGTLAGVLAVATVLVMVVLAAACIPQIPAAVQNLETPRRPLSDWWIAFTGVILALSGVESIANMTGVMKLDPNSPSGRPQVTKTARKAILIVMVEVVVLTTLFGLAMHAIPHMGARDHEGDMLRHLGQVFVDDPLKQLSWMEWAGGRNWFALIVSVVVGGLLLSATNTAIVALVSVLYLMAKDDELPKPFATINRFGVPWILMLIAILAPILVLDIQGKDALHGLAVLYAVGVVGAIAVNLGSCVFNFRLPMVKRERVLMGVTFVIVLAIEITILVTNWKAAVFAVVVLGLGFLARGLHKGFGVKIPESWYAFAERYSPTLALKRRQERQLEKIHAALEKKIGAEHPIKTIVVCAKGITPTLRYAVEQARLYNAQLVVLFIREVATTIPVSFKQEDDTEAKRLFNAVKEISEGVEVINKYAISDDPAWTILDHAATFGADMVILGHSRRTAFTRLLRGSVLNQVGSALPPEIRLVVVG
jgi:amino acid transporter